MTFCAICAAVLVCCSCRQHTPSGGSSDVSADSVNGPRYAKGYTVKTLPDGVRLVDVADPQKDKDRMPATYHFALVPRNVKATLSVMR